MATFDLRGHGYGFKAETFEMMTPEAARYLAEAEEFDAVKEYRRMRKIAQERLRKLRKAGAGNLEIYTDNVNRFPSFKEIGSDKRMLYDALSEVSRFLSSKRSTVGGVSEYFRQSQATFERHYGEEFGEDLLDWRTFGALMDAMTKSAASIANYTLWKRSYRAVQRNAKRAGLSPGELGRLVAEKKITIGPGGGLYDAGTQKRIRKGWRE